MGADQPWNGDDEDPLHPVHGASFVLGMGLLGNNASAQAAALWAWNTMIEPDPTSRTFGAGHDPFATSALYGLVYWPELTGVTVPVNPAAVYGLTQVDEFQKYFLFRNVYRDENDVLVTFAAGANGGVRGAAAGNACYPMAGGFTWWGLGLRFQALFGEYGGGVQLPEASSNAALALASACASLSEATVEVFRQLDSLGGNGVLSWQAGGDPPVAVVWSTAVDLTGQSGAALLFVISNNTGNCNTFADFIPEKVGSAERMLPGPDLDPCSKTEPAQGHVFSLWSQGIFYAGLTLQCGAAPPVVPTTSGIRVGSRSLAWNGNHLVVA
jgi:hypothetical protein